MPKTITLYEASDINLSDPLDALLMVFLIIRPSLLRPEITPEMSKEQKHAAIDLFMKEAVAEFRNTLEESGFTIVKKEVI